MHSALVSAIVSSTVRWLHLNCEWFTDNAPHEFFAAKTFCELVNFWGRNLPVISLSPNWTVYIFYFGPCAIRCVKVNFLSDIFAKLTFEKFSPRKIFVPLEDFSELSERDFLIWKNIFRRKKIFEKFGENFLTDSKFLQSRRFGFKSGEELNTNRDTAFMHNKQTAICPRFFRRKRRCDKQRWL